MGLQALTSLSNSSGRHYAVQFVGTSIVDCMTQQPNESISVRF
jgi:hypothetical protein